MIKKNTKIIFEGEENNSTDELAGGMPLSRGDTVHIHHDGGVVDYEVVDKTIDCFMGGGDDQVVNIVYKLKKVI